MSPAGIVNRLRPRFSLLTLMLAALACGAGMLVWRHWAPWEIERQQKIEGADYISSVTFAPDGQSFAIGGLDNRIEVRGVDFRLLLRVPGSSLAFDGFLAGGRWVKLVARQNPLEDSQCDIWDVDEGRRVCTLFNRGLLPAEFSISPNRRFVFSNNFQLAAWEQPSGRRIVDFMNIGCSPCFPRQEFVAAQQHAKDEALNALPSCRDLISFYKLMRGPARVPDNFIDRALLGVGIDPLVSSFDLGTNSYPYGLFVKSTPASNGSRIATQIYKSTVIQIWDGDTLQKTGDVDVEEGFEIQDVSSTGTFATVAAGERTRVIDLKTGVVEAEIPSVPFHECSDRVAFFHDDHCVLKKYRCANKSAPHLEQLYDWKRGAVLLSADYLYLDPENSSPDLRLCSRERGKLTSLKDGTTLFEYDSLDAEDAHEFKAFAPDSQHMMTQRAGTLYYWRNTRPEAWWGIFWRPHAYLFIAFLVMTVWSIFRRRGTAASSSQATA
jgi:hypothetical protein